MNAYLRLARPFFVLLAVFTVARWLMGTFGVPYDKGHHVFSLVILTVFSSLYYGAFGRRWLGQRLFQAAILAYLLGLAAQVVIVLATALSYGLGMDTYFTHPRALNAEGPIPFSDALVRRVGGLIANPLLAAMFGGVGWALGGLLPEPKHPPSE